jgi:hypothetical protein
MFVLFLFLICAIDHSCALLLRNPITGIACCCARAASGHVAAAPPKSVMNCAVSFDHLVGEQLHRFGDRETKGLSRLHVDHKFKLGRLLDR